MGEAGTDLTGPLLAGLAAVASLLLGLAGWWRLARRRRRPAAEVEAGDDYEASFTDEPVVADRLVKQVVDVGGVRRCYELYVPPRYGDGRALPVVFVFHGGGGSSRGIAKGTLMHRLARLETFIVVYPLGVIAEGARGRSWNAGGRGARQSRDAVDDAGLFLAILERLAGQFRIDRRRVYVAGFSKGGMLAYDLARRFPDQVAAVAAVAANMVGESEPGGPVAILHIHGTADERMPIGGGAGGGLRSEANLPSVEETLEVWRAINRCVDEPVTVYDHDNTICVRYTAPETGADVEFCRVEGGSHAWPGSPVRQGRPEDTVFPATEYVWEFFREHARPGTAAPLPDHREPSPAPPPSVAAPPQRPAHAARRRARRAARDRH